MKPQVLLSVISMTCAAAAPPRVRRLEAGLSEGATGKDCLRLELALGGIGAAARALKV
jgi:hypothetical protein